MSILMDLSILTYFYKCCTVTPVHNYVHSFIYTSTLLVTLIHVLLQNTNYLDIIQILAYYIAMSYN